MNAHATALKNRNGSATSRGESETVVSDDVIERLSNVFKMLSDPSRLKILLALAQGGEMHVTALTDLLGQSQPAISHHLTLMKSTGLVARRRDGKHNYYRVEARTVGLLFEEFCADAGTGDANIQLDELVRFFRRN